jgi:hypothetical protein
MELAMIRQYCLARVLALLLFALVTGTAAGQDACVWEPPDHLTTRTPDAVIESGNMDTYTGIIRVYVTEITGRWNDNWGGPFHNAFLAFALEESISLNETDTLTWELEWDGHDYFDIDNMPYDDLQEDNIKVFAAVFNSDGYPGYSNPPSDNEFMVHEVDASAEATCGTTGNNLVTDNFTHSVLVEDGTSSW